MKLAIMQPYFFPYIGYFQAIHAVDKYIVYDKLNYIYQGWVDRNRLVDKSGKIFYIRPQLNNASVSNLISEIEFHPNQIWKKKLLKTLAINYSQTVHFKTIYPLLEEIINFETKFLSDFNFNLIFKISKFLDIKTEIVTETEKYAWLENKLRNVSESEVVTAFPDVKLKNPEIKVIRAVEICKSEKANEFINAAGGAELYDKGEFKNNGIDLKFINTGEYFYPQFSTEFYPHLSIIDVLMHNGKEGTKEILNKYKLI